MWLNLIIVHLIEIIGIAIFLLVRRNNALEKAVIEQKQYIDAISIVINNSQQKLEELDVLGAFKTDDEVGTFFKNLKEIQDILNDFSNKN